MRLIFKALLYINHEEWMHPPNTRLFSEVFLRCLGESLFISFRYIFGASGILRYKGLIPLLLAVLWNPVASQEPEAVI